MRFGKPKPDEHGLKLIESGDLEAALFYFKNSLQQKPDDLQLMIHLATVHFLKGKYAECRDLFLKAVEKDPDKSQILQILQVTNHKKLASEKYFNSFPAISPDGKWAAFTSARRDTNGDGRIDATDLPGLYVVNVQTGAETEVAPDQYYNGQPSFSPDGRKLIFLSARKDLNLDGKIDHTELPGLYLKDLDTGVEECLVEPEHRPKFPSFSPDGQSIVLCSWHYQSRVCGVYLFDLKTRLGRTLQGRFECNFPTFSPSGESIIYASWRQDTNKDGVVDLRDNSALYQTNVKSLRETLLVSDQFSNSYPKFSPSGDSVLYLSRRRDTNEDGAVNSLDNSGIYLLNLSKNKERRIVSDENYTKFPCFSHDGQRVIFIAALRDPKVKRDPDRSEYFEYKGIYSVDRDGGDLEEIVSPKYYGCRFLTASPKGNWIVYSAWRKDTNRGLYAASIDKFPSKQELKDIIRNAF